MTEHQAFTYSGDRIYYKLITPAHICLSQRALAVNALWDTGATGSCISKKVVKDLGLISIGREKVSTPSGESIQNQYLVDVILPNKVKIGDVVVLDSEIGIQGFDLLIGMNIISLGDFSVSNANSKTIFSFCIPSRKATDFVKQINAEKKVGKPHGTGKRKKKKK